jgi:hypothetical protein
MRLEHLCDMQLSFNEHQAMVRPYGGEEGSVFVAGTGTVSGDRLRGTLYGVNHAHRRSDGVMLPDIHGVITAENNAAILFHLHGLTTAWQPIAEGLRGNMISWISFETEAEQYRWLNHAQCILESSANVIPGRGAFGPWRVYLCINEML